MRILLQEGQSSFLILQTWLHVSDVETFFTAQSVVLFKIGSLTISSLAQEETKCLSLLSRSKKLSVLKKKLLLLRMDFF